MGEGGREPFDALMKAGSPTAGERSQRRQACEISDGQACACPDGSGLYRRINQAGKESG